MKIKLLLLLLLPISFLQAQLLKPLPNNLDKRILIAHPTVTNIHILSTLSTKGLINLNKVQLIGIYHSNENYEYRNSQAVLDTISTLNMYLVELKDSISTDKLYQRNDMSDDFIELFKNSSAAFFFGGPDIPPAIYGEELNPLTKVCDPYRHYFEASFIFHLLGGSQNKNYSALLNQKPNYLVHGICLGMQTMNIATGGSLIQDIPSEIYHRTESNGLSKLGENEIHRNYYKQMSKYDSLELTGFHFHKIDFEGSFFPKLTGVSKKASPTVNSYHHQAIDNLGMGFKVSAKSIDGKIIEAIYHKKFSNVFGIQFHPERSDFFMPTCKVQFKPNGEKKTLQEWIDIESLNFYKAYWMGINERLQNL
ncbi:gamma-glutamyl-gamma-aminobutyrate hydrolase family protein [Ancylomarina sp. 16SWW S1-10-2]|uniref:gamma-glutamyl-gamma-aminobutyrate hydrolase family protein n=1 Tax=Ancylomarina sp. 16SWW S1-10-2 TaxID=2499681 RepID=UPI0012AE5B65|nr:gamma-glutamyl-gamma-aminobutyrate hydrolase family protein [Ancylomarina sp. 16SWW S1-10-2]MRT92768.1 hypothetical protein [Ancylomarina sp. 16SWW S1-10-2]